MPAPLVFDNNIYTYAPIDSLAALHRRGLVLRVSDVAFNEAVASSVRDYEQHRLSRERARGRLFGRARSLKPYIDPAVPIAASGGQLAKLVIAEVDGVLRDPEDERYATHLADLWERITGDHLTDEEWITAGHEAETHLAQLDGNLSDLARPDEELRSNPVPDGVDPVDLAEQQARWDSLSDEQRFAALRKYVKETWRMSPLVAERFDGHIAVTARRFHEAATRQRQTGENDGADAALTMHLGDGCFVVTRDVRLIKLVDRSETYQAPWVRHLDDLDDLPEGPPWGESARRQAATFTRRSLDLPLSA